MTQKYQEGVYSRAENQGQVGMGLGVCVAREGSTVVVSVFRAYCTIYKI